MQVGYSVEDEAFRVRLRDWFEAEFPRFKAQWSGAIDANDLVGRRAW